MKLPLITALALALALPAGVSHAGYCKAGPEFEAGTDLETNRDGDLEPSFFIGITIPLFTGSQKDHCEAEIEEAEADAEAQKLENLEHKIAICSEFEKDTAPGSIVELCGDLLQ